MAFCKHFGTGILESAAGTSDLARNANNHFGIKCHAGWEGKTYFKDDDKKTNVFVPMLL